jgi:hypothetical protein
MNPREKAETVKCPICQAEPNISCTNPEEWPTKNPLSHFHRERLGAYNRTPTSQEQFKARYGCIDCLKEDLPQPYDQYGLDSSLWRSLGLTPRDNLCLVHLEKRLGRFLTIEDFTPAKINNPIRFGYRMAQQVKQSESED